MSTEAQGIPQQLSENVVLLAALNQRSAEISGQLDADKKPWPPSDHADWNWASELGHPCMKYLVHCRLDWKEKQPIDLDGMWRIEEGIDQEWKVKKLFGNIEMEFRQSQRDFRIDQYKIKGKIDGLVPIRVPLAEVPGEVKSINPNYWQSIRTIEDVRTHSAWWIRKYPSQLNLYLAMTGIPAGFLILKTFGKKPMLLPMLFDQDLYDRDIRMAEAVNQHVEAKTYPEPMPFDPSVCGMCDFGHLCQPLKAADYVEIPENAIPELENYLLLKEYKKGYEELHRRLIGDSKKPGRYHGKNGIVGDIQIQTKISQRTFYEIPDEIKGPYADKREVVTTTIEKITD